MDMGKLRTELFRKHGIRIHEHDPLLDAAAVFDAIAADAAKTIEAVTKTAVDRITASHVNANEDAEARGKALISRGAQWLDEQWKETAKEAARSVLYELQQEREKVAELSRAATRAGWIAGGCAALTAAGLAGWLINALGMGLR